MTARMMRLVSRLVVRHPVAVVVAAAVITAILSSHIGALRMGTDLMDMFGRDNPEWKHIGQLGRELGYGNQLFILLQAPAATPESAEILELAADRLVAEMNESKLFRVARSGLTEEELLGFVRLFAWNFPAFAQPEDLPALRKRLDPASIRRAVAGSGAELVSAFSSLGTNYFVADPLGLMEVLARDGRGFSQFTSFDLAWGGGNRFYGKDRKTLLIISEPREAAIDYHFAEKVAGWTRGRIAAVLSDPEVRAAGIQATPVGAYVYAEQDRKFIQGNIRLISLISIAGNLLLCLLIYPRIPLLLLSLLPTSLGILWTTGIASYYPGEVNLISMSFIAILAGLGDDHIVHFFNRVPQEWRASGSLEVAMVRTFDTTGRSIVFCILTAATATVALATSGFKVLSEFGFILTTGLAMMLLHTLLTVPALMRLWWRYSAPPAPESVTFRLLPAVAEKVVGFTGRHARLVAAVSLGALAVSIASLPAVDMSRKVEIARGDDNPAIAGQKLLSASFGIEGTPEILLITGTEEEALQRSEALTRKLEEHKKRGAIKSVFSPSSLTPSRRTQSERMAGLRSIDLNGAADALLASIEKAGFRAEPFQPFLDRLRQAGRAEGFLTVDQAAAQLPRGLLDNSVRRIGPDRYLAAIAYYATDPDATEAVPERELESWRRECGAFFEFSFNKINRDVQRRVTADSRRALWLTAGGILLLVYICLRRVPASLLALLPIVFAIGLTFGLLLLMGHRFSFMSLTALPLIIGIGIDNGLHLVRRYMEDEEAGILGVARSSGAALIQSNLTTIVGFGALTASSFEPLAELGMVTALGVALALVGGLVVTPAVIVVWRGR